MCVCVCGGSQELEGEVDPQLYQTAHHPIPYNMWYSLALDINKKVSANVCRGLCVEGEGRGHRKGKGWSQQCQIALHPTGYMWYSFASRSGMNQRVSNAGYM